MSGQLRAIAHINTPRWARSCPRQKKETIHHSRAPFRESTGSTSQGYQKKTMRRALPLCALLLVVLLCAASLADVAEARRGGRGGRAFGGAGGARGSHSGAPRGLSGGTWTACVGSSLVAAAAVLL
ncbi:hypothetical protein BAE44_0015463 [Dichanthelium oligosanthes]|uniref:Uncharacterized protein n=1 Tax=Dichanthelium oligosanthes TaxID=888268 RepID=A0A1E5VEI0_9POAL|nr:hypothetical protein BAE44_0015463 [Dichanthelium oligosanthes]